MAALRARGLVKSFGEGRAARRVLDGGAAAAVVVGTCATVAFGLATGFERSAATARAARAGS